MALHGRHLLVLMTAEDGDLREFKDARIAGKTTDIVLTALDKGHLRSLLADLLSQSEARVRELAAEIHGKTDGVPSHVLELLFELHDQNALFYDALHNQWTWDLEQVRAHFFSDNTRERIERQLEKLPAETLEAMEIGACVGDSFDAALVAAVSSEVAADHRRAPAQSRWRRPDRRIARGSGARHALPVRASARPLADLSAHRRRAQARHSPRDRRRADSHRYGRHVGEAHRGSVQRRGRSIRRECGAAQRHRALQPAGGARSAGRRRVPARVQVLPQRTRAVSVESAPAARRGSRAAGPGTHRMRRPKRRSCAATSSSSPACSLAPTISRSATAAR